jgi:DNA-binding beta-propeller fold protein YncE
VVAPKEQLIRGSLSLKLSGRRRRRFQIRAGLFRRFFDYLLGKTEGSIVTPYGVETDSSGRLYIIDTFLKTVHVFDVQTNKYHTFSTNKTTLESPIDLAIDHERGYIYVTDSKGGSVKIFKDKGNK